MLTQQIRRIGDDLVITIPDHLAARLNLREGQTKDK